MYSTCIDSEEQELMKPLPVLTNLTLCFSPSQQQHANSGG